MLRVGGISDKNTSSSFPTPQGGSPPGNWGGNKRSKAPFPVAPDGRKEGCPFSLGVGQGGSPESTPCLVRVLVQGIIWGGAWCFFPLLDRHSPFSFFAFLPSFGGEGFQREGEVATLQVIPPTPAFLRPGLAVEPFEFPFRGEVASRRRR